MKFLDIINDIFNVSLKADRIRADEVRRSKSVLFAVTSIIYSLVMIACAVVGAFLFSLTDTGILYIFIVVIAVTFFVSVIVEFIAALVRLIAQFRINKKPMTWIALAVLILSVAATAVIIVLFLTQ